MAAKPTPEPVTYYQLVGYTLRCWPQNHFYSANLVEILTEYNVPIYEAKKALGLLRGQGFAEYKHRPPGLWRIRSAAKNFPVSAGHERIYAALVDATQSNIDARLAPTDAPDKSRAVVFRRMSYNHIAGAALQIWPYNHFEARHLARYCDQFASRLTNPHARATRALKEDLVADGRLWFSAINTRLGRITARGRMAPLGPRGPELLAAMRAHPPEALPPWQDLVLAFALEHPGEWKLAHLMRWLGPKEGAPCRSSAHNLLNRLESKMLVEKMPASGPRTPRVYRTRLALYEAAAPDFTLYEQLLYPEGRALFERCYPKGLPQDLNQVGKVAPELADEATVAAMALPAKQGLEQSKTPGTAQVVTLKGSSVEEELPEPVAHIIGGDSSMLDKTAGLIDYINELRAGAGVTEVGRLRGKVDNLTGALQAVRNENTSQKRAIAQLNAIKARQEEQIKDLSSQLAQAKNRLQTAKTQKRTRVRTRTEKGTGFGLGEVATFKGRPLAMASTPPVVEKKRARD